MRKALGWIFNRWVLGMLGLIAISLIIWYVGPLVEIAKFAPLEPAWIRQLLIAIVIIVYLGRLLWRAGRAALANRKLMDGLLKSGPKDPVPAAPQRGAEEVAMLAKRFQVAIDVLKRANVDSKAKRAGFRALNVFRRRQYLYDLPWYMIIGAPGSGKTTALLNAGLNFPLADRLGKDAIRGIGGTRNCDWWFTDEAVLLDTAGRYTTQDSDAQADQVAWNGFLGLLKQHRPRRPINGVFVALSVADLAERSVADRTAHANKLRARIQELHQSVGIRFPIYVLITKVDLLAGFTEFFNDLGKDDRAQVWGVTFPFAGESATEMDSLASSKAELEQLGRRLNERLIDRLQAERDPQRRSLIYGFPQQWSLLTDTLNEFLDAVFAPSRFEQKPLVRGVYFTSGTQEGMPIDRLFGALGRALGLARRAQCPPAESGRSFFLSRLLKEVVFRESDLAGTNFKWVRRRALIQTAAVVGMLVLTALAIIAWGVSYSRNKAYVAEVNSKVVAIAQQIEAPQSSGHDLVGLLPLMNSVRDLASTSPDASDATPFSMGFGLYQGDKLDIASRSAYQRLLRDAFLPRLTARIEKQLAGDDRNNPELQYEALRTYLMLHDAKRYDGDAVRAFIKTDWNGTLPRDLAIDRRKELSRHLETLLGLPEVTSPLSPNEALIALARTAIGRTPLAARAYSRLKRFGVGADIPTFTITKEGGPSALLVIVRASGRPLTEGIPGLYTYNGYHKAFRAGTEKVVKQLAGEAQWVMGESSSRMAGWLPGPARESLANEVLRLYLEDYARLWEAFIKDIHVVRAGDLQKGIQITQVLGSGVESPLPKLFRAIVREVTLGQVPEAQKTLIDKGADALKEKSEDLRKLLGQTGVLPTKQADQTLVERTVDARFEYLRRLVTPGSGGKSADRRDDQHDGRSECLADGRRQRTQAEAHPASGRWSNEQVARGGGLAHRSIELDHQPAGQRSGSDRGSDGPR